MVSEGISESFTAMIARSVAESVPLIAAETSLLSENVTVRSVEPATTWLLVAIRSSVSFFPTIMPEPLLCVWYACVLPKKSLCWMVMVSVIATIDGMAFSTIAETSVTVETVVVFPLPGIVFGAVS